MDYKFKNDFVAYYAGYRDRRVLSLKCQPQKDQKYSNNSVATADELFECVWPFCGVGT